MRMQEKSMTSKHHKLVEFNAEMIGKATSKDTGKTIRLSITEDAGWNCWYNGKHDKRLRI